MYAASALWLSCPFDGVQVVEEYKQVSGFDLVEPAHMELAEPSIATGEAPGP
jgi:hypothetical protein